MANYWKLKEKGTETDYNAKYCMPLGSESNFLCLPDKNTFKKIFKGYPTKEELNGYEFIPIKTSVSGVEKLNSFANYYEKVLGGTVYNSKSGRMKINMSVLDFNRRLITRFKESDNK